MASVSISRIIRSKRKTLALYIQSDASLIIKAPLYAPMQVIEKFIQQNREWIDQQKRKRMQRKIPTEKKYETREKFLYLGKEYVLQIENCKNIHIRENKIFFPSFLTFRIKKEMTSWYIQQAREIITKQVDFYAKQMNANYKTVSFSDTKSKWGSCTHDNHLQFCWRLIMAPLLAINYVIVHELTHTTEKNHSQDFWRKVRFHNPSYRQQRKWLNEFGDKLQF